MYYKVLFTDFYHIKFNIYDSDFVYIFIYLQVSENQKSALKVVEFIDQAKILDNLNKKNGIFLIPLNCALNSFILALKNAADAFVYDCQNS